MELDDGCVRSERECYNRADSNRRFLKTSGCKRNPARIDTYARKAMDQSFVAMLLYLGRRDSGLSSVWSIRAATAYFSLNNSSCFTGLEGSERERTARGKARTRAL